MIGKIGTIVVMGRVGYYPRGENAKYILALTKMKTLSELEIEALKALVCTIERVSDDPGAGEDENQSGEG